MKNTNLFQIIKHYKWKSVFFKYLTNLFLIILIIFIPYNIFIYTYFDYILEKEISTTSATNALKSKDIFDLLTAEFNINANIISDNKHVQRYLSTMGSHDDSESCIELISSMTNSSTSITESFIYNISTNKCILSNTYVENENVEKLKWLNTYKATKLPFLMFPRKNRAGVFSDIYICRELYNNVGTLTGVYCAKLDYSAFTNIIHKSFEENPEKIFIVSDIGLILYSNQPELINTLMFEHKDIYQTFKSAKDGQGNTLFIDNYIISVAKSQNSNLLLMSYRDKNSISSDYSRIYVLLIVGGITVLIVSFILALFFSFRYYASIVSVMQTIEDPTLTSNDLLGEFFYISHTISGMSQKNQSMKNELAEKLVTLKKAQIEALQAQINPHFLFNTLQLINFSIIKEIKSDNSATKLISLLSNLMHSAYDTDNFIVTVNEEVENVIQYIEIQKARYNSKLLVNVDVDSECLSHKTVKLILQPFIENSIVHGLRGRTSGWCIALKCFKDNENIIFELSDNGTGIPADLLEQLNTSLRQIRSGKQGSVGISNVNKRLKLVFGNQSSIVIKSSPEWTTVTISHPVTDTLEV